MGSARDIQRESKLCGFKVWAGGVAVIVLVLSPSPVQPVGWHYLSSIEPYLNRPNLNLHEVDEICLLHSSDSLGPHPNQFEDLLRLIWWLTLTHVTVFLGQLSGICGSLMADLSILWAFC